MIQIFKRTGKHIDRGTTMGFRSLAEAVILQSLEDLWDPAYRKGSKTFFEGEGFKIYAAMANLNSLNRYKIIHLVGGKRHGRAAGVHRD